LIGSLVVHHLHRVLQRGEGPIRRGTFDGLFRSDYVTVPNPVNPVASELALSPRSHPVHDSAMSHRQLSSVRQHGHQGVRSVAGTAGGEVVDVRVDSLAMDPDQVRIEAVAASKQIEAQQS